jgi:hypothetical protein
LAVAAAGVAFRDELTESRGRNEDKR